MSTRHQATTSPPDSPETVVESPEETSQQEAPSDDESSESPESQSPVGDPSETGSGAQEFGRDGKAEFEHFTVEILPIEQEGSAQYPNFQIEVCVVKAAEPDADGNTRVSTDPWTLETQSGVTADAQPSTGFSPAFPAEEMLAVGDCATGWIEFQVDSDEITSTVTYENSVDERAVWSYDV